MCGIAGILRRWRPASGEPLGEGVPESWIAALDRSIRHRGPDGQGVFRDWRSLHGGERMEVALIHRRLTILDAAAGAQPMSRSRSCDMFYQGLGLDPHWSEDRLVTVFNGCIYNHREVRSELASLGYVFESDHSDTEVIPHGWREWQERLAGKLDGMFAFAVWDRGRAQLCLARDRAGEKPIYIWTHKSAEHGEVVAFASTVSALLELRREVAGRQPPPLDAGLLRRWFIFGFDDQPPIHGIEQVPPGCWLTLGMSSPELGRYWAPPQRGGDPGLDVRGLLRASVLGRLEADVPLGCFLSGGIDSPLIAAMAREAKADLRTFTVRMPDARYDESERAARIARHLGTRHTTLDCHATPAEDLVSLITQLGLPLGDSSLLPTHWVSRAAREHVTVALSGDGADELFGGYQRYAAAGWLSRWRSLLAVLPAWGSGSHPRSRTSKFARLVEAARGWGYADLLAIFPKREALDVLGGAADLVVTEEEMIPRDPQRGDFLTYLPGDLLRKVDTASMAVALEVRAPFLATAMVERCLSAPASGYGKRELRSLAAQFLPREIAEGPKSGFAIPIGDWFRTDFGGLKKLLRETLGDPGVLELLQPALPIDPGRVKTLVDEHLAGTRDHSQRLYQLVVLAVWARSL